MIQFHLFKKKEGGEGRSPFSGQWKEKEKVPMLGGQWKEKEKVLFHLFPLCPQATLLRPSFFSFNIKVLLYHGSKLLFYAFPPFSLAFKLWSHILMLQVPHTFIVDSIWLKYIFFSLKLWHCVCHVLWALSYVSEWKIDPKIIFRFDVDTTSLWWKPWTTRGAHSSWSRSPLSFVLSHFSELSHLSDFVASWPCFWQWI